jgi:ADP-heptose:LPS heptosyltransferase
MRTFGYLRRPAVSADGEVRRILISYPYCNLGDLVLMLPMLEATHERWPKAALELAVNARTAELLASLPFIDRVYPIDHSESWMPGFTSYKRVFSVVALYRKEMMSKDYDLAIMPRWGEDPFYGSYLAYLTGAPKRCGYSAIVDGRDSAEDLLLTQAATGGDHEQEALRDLRLLSRVGLREETSEDKQLVDRPITSLRTIAATAEQATGGAVPSAPYVVISPGGTHPRRLWPTENLAALVSQLKFPSPTKFYVIGSVEDARRGEELVRQFPNQVISLAGKTNLMQLIALIANAILFVGNDSGPAHIAGALGVATVVISPFPTSCKEEHPNSPVRFRPCGPRVSVVQPREPLPPCFPACSSNEPHCITQVSVEQVLAAADALIENASDLSRPRR